MNPIRRELLNGLFVLVVASLLSVAFAAFQVNFNVLLWVLILMGIAIAISGYVMFEMALGYMASTEDREKEWLNPRVQANHLFRPRRVGERSRIEIGYPRCG